MTNSVITKEQAIEKAQKLGAKTYGKLTPIVTAVIENEEYWIVNFINPQALVDGAGQHFAVWIHKPDGKARLFKGR